jgi:hypothetical protein
LALTRDAGVGTGATHHDGSRGRRNGSAWPLQLCEVTGPVVQPSLRGPFRGGDGEGWSGGGKINA